MTEGGVEVTHVDGVPVLHADLDGPLRAVLLFRVGQADETLPVRGVTHLVEHLALSTTERGPHAYNGATAGIFTSFVVAAEPDEVSKHLHRVCRGLGELPLDRFDHERGILKTEAAQGGGAAARSLAAWRWGPVGHGLLGYDELGVEGLTTQATAAWARQWFTRDNAVLWLSGPVPPDLALPLVGPPRKPRPELPSTQAVVALPARYTFSPKGVAMSYLVPRSDAGPAFLYILQKRLQTRLRDQLGLSYGVQAVLDPTSASQSQHLLVADCLPENATEAQKHFTEVVAELLEHPVSRDELEQFQAFATLAESDTVSRTLSHLDYVARQHLLGAPIKTVEELRAERQALCPDDVSEVASLAASSLLLALPDASQLALAWAPLSAAWSPTTVTGTTYQPSAQATDRRVRALIVGDEGISLTTDEGAVTVAFSSCAGMMRFADGGRVLLGNDGFMVRFHPGDWQDAGAVTAHLDSHVPGARWLVGGATAATGSRSSVRQQSVTTVPGKRRIRLTWRRRGVVIATLFAIGGIARLVDGGGSTTPPPPDYGINSLSGLSGSTFVDGECLDTASGSIDLQISCDDPHTAEVITSSTISGSSDLQDPASTCNRAAQQLLTRSALSSVTVLALPDTADGQLVCVAMAKDAGMLQAPLARSHTTN